MGAGPGVCTWESSQVPLIGSQAWGLLLREVPPGYFQPLPSLNMQFWITALFLAIERYFWLPWDLLRETQVLGVPGWLSL